jgi:CheY-like chemotaxis protein
MGKPKRRFVEDLTKRLSRPARGRATLAGSVSTSSGAVDGEMPSPDERGARAAAPDAIPRGIVMLVEDDPGLARVYASLLERYGLTVFTARSGVDALAALANGAQPRAVWCDLDLGSAPDGVSVLHAAAGCASRPLLLLVTSSPAHARAREAPLEAVVFAKAHAADAAMTVAMMFVGGPAEPGPSSGDE